jgi:ubiquinone/menaquinone biosynthesis C-methylase UbiE
MTTLLHVGCGQKRIAHTTPGFNTPEWQELRLDIDTAVQPDVVGSMTDMSAVASESVDAVFSSHNIEHLYPHEVPVALSEFLRVLKPDGFVVITCPDLKSVCALVAQDKLLEPAYQSPAGPVSPIDILYGHRPAMARGNLFMAHRGGFTQTSMVITLKEAGFQNMATVARNRFLDLWAIATKQACNEQRMHALAKSFFPL